MRSSLGLFKELSQRVCERTKIESYRVPRDVEIDLEIIVDRLITKSGNFLRWDAHC